VAGIVAMATALDVTTRRRAATGARVGALRDRLLDGLLASVPDAVETVDRTTAVPGIAHLRFAGVDAEALVILLDQAGVAVSAGAACSSGALEPSHVLAAMGLEGPDARSGIRFSLGSTSTGADVDLAVSSVPDLVARLRN
jgi:cysteine desulfurase